VSVDSGTDVKAKVGIGSDYVSYPVITTSQTTPKAYEKVVIEYSQNCLGLVGCEQPSFDFSLLPPGVAVVRLAGKITLTGPYEDINQATKNLVIRPGAGNPNNVNVKITASVADTDLGLTVTDFDSFVIPVVSVS